MTPADLQRFCSRDHRRPNLHAPFSRGDFTYASDGVVIVRVARLADVAEISTAPAAESLPFADANAAFTKAPTTIELPAVKELECECCSGRGSQHDCPQCTCECEECGGHGQVLETVTVGIGPANFSAKHLKRILVLPNLQLGPLSFSDPVPFRFDGGDGLIMPVRGKHRHHVDVTMEAAA